MGVLEELERYEHFVIAEWRNWYVDRQELRRTFQRLEWVVQQDDAARPGGGGGGDVFACMDVEAIAESIREEESRVGGAFTSGSGARSPGLGSRPGTPGLGSRPGTPRKELRGKDEEKFGGQLGGFGGTPGHSRSGSFSPTENSPLLNVLVLDNACEEQSASSSAVSEAALLFFVQNTEKVQWFYNRKLNEFERNLDWLKSALDKRTKRGRTVAEGNNTVHVDREAESIQRAYVDLYRHLKFLEAYSGMNYTILSMVAKQVSPTLTEYLESKSFWKMKSLRRIIHLGETVYAEAFHNYNRTAARTALLLKQHYNLPGDQVHFGFYSGVCMTLLIWLFWDLTVDNSRIWRDGSIFSTAAFPVFRGILSGILVLWSWSISCFMWSKYRINFIYMFQLDPRILPTVEESFTEAARFTVVALVTVLLYFKTVIGTFPQWFRPGVYPVILVAYVSVKILTSNATFGKYVLSVVATVLAAPFADVSFFSIFIGDWLTSLVKPGLDVAYGVCYFASGLFLEETASNTTANTLINPCHNNNVLTFFVYPLISVLPLWLRFMQCLRRTYDSGERNPNLYNAAKYSLAMIVVLLGSFHPFDLALHRESFATVWILLFCASGLFSFFWDVRMDWGLGRKKHAFLSDTLMYEQKRFYYAAIVADFFLRFSWLLTLVEFTTFKAFLGLSFLPKGHFIFLAQTLIEITEVMRRTMWGLFRLENEHLRNTLHFRDSNFIPLHFDAVYKDDKKITGRGAQGPKGVVHAIELVTLALLVVMFSVVVVGSRFFANI